MENLAFVELKGEEKFDFEHNKNESKFNSSLYGNTNSFGFMTSYIANVTETVSAATSITTDIIDGKYSFKTKYTIIYLYDLNDSVAKDFLSTFGGKLHRQSSANITILTYFTEGMEKQWKGIKNKKELEESSWSNANNVKRIIRYLQNKFEIEKLPVMIIVKENMHKFGLKLSPYRTPDSLYKYFRDIMNTIVDNYDEKFSVIKDKIADSSEKIEKVDKIEDFDTFNFVEELVSKSNDPNYNLDGLAYELGMSTRNLLNKRKNNSFTRDECLFIGLKFHLNERELNDLLRSNNNVDLAFDGRDGIIRRCLYENVEVEEVHEILLSEHLDGVIDYEKREKIDRKLEEKTEE